MRIAVIGPSRIERVAAAAGLDAGLIRSAAAEAGEALARAGHELAVVPDRGVAVIAAEAYRRAGGRRLWGFVPRSGKSAEGATGRVHENSRLCDETFRDLTWHEQHSRLVEFSDAMVCIGLSCGTICEIAWTKWTKRIPVFMIETLASRVSPEIEAETDIRYVKDVAAAIASLGKPEIPEQEGHD